MLENLHLERPLAVFDIESTGVVPQRDRIVEIGAVRVETDGTLSRYETLVNPGVPIPWQVTKVHGIDDEMVADAPKFKDAAYPFLDFIRGSKLVAHNARFDFSFLQESLARTALPIWKYGIYDSIILIRRAYPGLSSYSLQSLRQSLGLGQDIDEARPHRAGYDAELTMEAFAMAMRRLYSM